MSITLSPEQERFIQEKLQDGKYRSPDEVLSEAFRLLEERDKHYEQWLNETSEKVAVGLAELERGEGLDSEIVMAQLQAKYGINGPAASGRGMKKDLLVSLRLALQVRGFAPRGGELTRYRLK